MASIVPGFRDEQDINHIMKERLHGYKNGYKEGKTKTSRQGASVAFKSYNIRAGRGKSAIV
jgi:hypothetical protein